MPVYLGVSALQEGALGMCLMVTDLTEQRHYQELQRTQEALRASEERLELAQRAGRIGTFEWDIRTGAVSWSATRKSCTDCRAGGFGGRYEDWKQAVHPDDRAAPRPTTAEPSPREPSWTPNSGSSGRTEQTRWIASKGKVFYGPTASRCACSGSSVDITERKRTEEELRDADRKKDEFLAMLGPRAAQSPRPPAERPAAGEGPEGGRRDRVGHVGRDGPANREPDAAGR